MTSDRMSPEQLAQVEHLLRLARAYASDRLPWFAPALFAARLVLTELCPSLAAVDHRLRVYWNPRFVAEMLDHANAHGRVAGEEISLLLLAELGFVWVHEISHVLRDHRSRAIEREAEPMRWNVAADLEINDASWEGLEHPRLYPPLLPKRLRLPEGLLAESYYDRIEVHACSVCDEGSGVHGQSRGWELEAAADDRINTGLSPVELDLLRMEVAQAIKMRGDMPGGWARWAEEVLHPKVNWRELLRRKLRGAATIGSGARIDYTYQRVNRRASQFVPYIRPSLSAAINPRITCVIDTSGSISDRDLAQSLAEVREVLVRLQTPVRVIPCDAVPYPAVDLFTNSDLLQLKNKLYGGGGTDMVAGIDTALADRARPDVILVLTDGLTPYPSSCYAIPVLFGLIESNPASPAPRPPMPPWKEDDLVVIPVGDQ